MKSILFNNACVITAFFSLVLTFLSPNLLGKRNLKGRYFFLALFGFQDAVSALSCETALILYHIFLNLSSTFFKFFSNSFLCDRRSFLLSSFFIISHFLLFVKYFFQLFSNIFYVIPAPLRAALILYHLSLVLSSTFFQILSYFSQSLIWFSFTRPLRRQLLYYSTFIGTSQHVIFHNVNCQKIHFCVHFYTFS